MLVGGRAHSIRDVVEIAKAGFPFAEISIIDRGLFYDVLEQLKSIRAAYGLSYLAHGPEEGNAREPDVLRRDYLPQVRTLLDCARELSIGLFTIHFWIDRRFIGPEIMRDKLQLLSDMVFYAAQQGITLCIENLSERFSDFAGAFEEIAPLGMTLDIGHGALITEKNTAYEFTECCFERIRHVHIHDNRGGNSPRDDLHLPLGAGTIDFAPILNGLKQRGFDRTITIEVRPEHLAGSSTTLQQLWESL
jgi:sugar phosphate isomerase/epimerase